MPENLKIIAEIGVNHNGSMNLATELIEAAAEAGADFVKFQSFNAEKITTAAAKLAEYQTKSTNFKSQFEMLKGLELTAAQHELLLKRCEMVGVQFLSTPFDLEALHFLTKTIKLPAIKIASGDITFGPLLFEAALTGLPVFLSTGMSNLNEISAALEVLEFGYGIFDSHLGIGSLPTKENRNNFYRDTGGRLTKERVTVLHCTSEYTAPAKDLNLLALRTIENETGCKIGYSDHSDGILFGAVAVALGATLLEKHITLDRHMSGPDHAASLEPSEFKKYIEYARACKIGLGDTVKECQPIEESTRSVVRRGVYLSGDAMYNDKQDLSNLSYLRPPNELSPMDVWG